MENLELEMAFKYAQYTHRNIFLTGKAGTGKTTFLRRLEQITNKQMIIVAPTGVAAINAGGVTIHSFFQLAPGMYLPGQDLAGREKKSKFSYSKLKINILRTLDLLVIDEISMVRCDLLDAIDEVLRRFQNRYLPFGGVQLLMIGDLQQLAPVAKEDEWQILKEHGYTTPYFFGSQALQKTNYTTIELKQVYRQADQEFVDLLNQVRDNRMTSASLAKLNARVNQSFQPKDEEGYITLTTHNVQAANINSSRLQQLPTQPMVYKAIVKGDFPEMSYPTDEELTLKIGAQVMFCKNDPNHTYYNGKIGRVVKCDAERVWVECAPDSLDPNQEQRDEKPKTIEVTRQIWENMKYSTDPKTGKITEDVAGTYQQIPLKTAWAITIHKSQGLTFDRAIIQAERAFSPGQVYVALSRCRTLEGLVLSRPIPASAIFVDPQVMSFNRFVEMNQPTPKQLIEDRRQCIEEILGNLFDYNQLLTRLNYLHRLAEEHLSRIYPNYVRKLKLLSNELEGVNDSQKKESPLQVGRIFQGVIHQMMPLTENFDDNTALHERLNKGFAWFLNRTVELLQDLIDEGLPDIDNQATKEQMEREFELLSNDYNLKIQILTNCLGGFSLDAYWDAKALASMNADNPKAAKKKMPKAPKEKAPEKVKVAASDDIKNPKLYDALREWRMKKAYQLKVPPYSILHNSTLVAITNNLPANQKELIAMPGIGKRSMEAFGNELLELVKNYRNT
jgi:hypothetical protein